MIDFDEIRREVAMEQNALIGKEDPILMAATINRVMFEHYLKASTEEFVKLLAEHRKEADAANKQALENSKIVAGRLITEASEYVAKEWKQVMKEAVDEKRERQIRVEEPERKGDPRYLVAATGYFLAATLMVAAVYLYAFP
ncbi:MAG: hypothetical protein ABI216_22215 [Devosia sp.]